MKIKTPALQRTLVATRYQHDYTVYETTFDVKVKRETQTPIYALRPTTATVLDYDFKAAKRLRGVAGTAAAAGITLVGLAAIPVIAAYFVGRDLFASLKENLTDAGDAGSWVIAEGLSTLRATISEVLNP